VKKIILSVVVVGVGRGGGTIQRDSVSTSAR